MKHLLPVWGPRTERDNLLPMAALTNKVVIITGPGSGIGQSTATLLARCFVLLSCDDINAQTVIDELRQLFRASSTITVVVDSRSQEACGSHIVDTVTHYAQSIAGAVNLAGFLGASVA